MLRRTAGNMGNGRNVTVGELENKEKTYDGVGILVRSRYERRLD